MSAIKGRSNASVVTPVGTVRDTRGIVLSARTAGAGTQKRGQPSFALAYIRELEAQIQSYKAQTENTTKDHSRASSIVPNDVTAIIGDEQRTNSTPVQEIPTTSTCTSKSYGEIPAGPAFVTQVRTLLSAHSTPDHLYNQDIPAKSAEQSSALSDMLASTTLFTQPSQEESYRLLELFLVYLGVSQHFLDPRVFSDNITLLFLGGTPSAHRMDSLWYVQYLLVMAMGRLLDHQSERRGNALPPGWDYFAEAMRRLPSLTQLRECGVLAVEILAVATTYLQWTDWPDEAYLYIGMSIRLAMALGCFRPCTEQKCLPSEANHRLRLWWTVYMLCNIHQVLNVNTDQDIDDFRRLWDYHPELMTVIWILSYLVHLWPSNHQSL
ncbi:hypothetical protein E4T38_08947 [Aureobasidium subglaciale]|nr:hypothetical protein E4T38_08947 [Aureobasidium subglaciale]KAI5214597.1 hypothetical protein E4T40_08907 [Aureobasidium subglaciale]KAI5217388.1 hypothetical protein E4T41_08866 [Aureobasidium subglaciale]KAI5255028.1 hypothetical protein E4T46_08900 [Aureobasidium subglaciale]